MLVMPIYNPTKEAEKVPYTEELANYKHKLNSTTIPIK